MLREAVHRSEIPADGARELLARVGLNAELAWIAEGLMETAPIDALR